MSDARLRVLERRWRETGVVADEAAWIIERLRVGDVIRERVRAAAILGYPAATMVMTHRKHHKRSFMHALKVHGVGSQGWVRALVVILRRICDHFRFNPRPALIIEILQLAWVWSNNPESEVVPSRAWNLGNQSGITACGLTGMPDEVAFRFAAVLATFLRRPSNDFHCDLQQFILHYGGRSGVPFLVPGGMQAMLEPILGAWLLGYSDPLPIDRNPSYEHIRSS